MKFVCERCHTKYSIADEKVRGKVLKVRCKTCTNVITVRETGATIDDAAGAGLREAPISLSGSIGDKGAAKPAAAKPAAAKPAAAKPAALPADALFSPAAPVAAPPPKRSTTAAAVPPPPPPIDGVEWYLAVDGAQTGPFSHSRLCDKILALHVGADVHVWSGDFDGWKPPKDVAELDAELNRRRRSLTPAPPPPPRRPSGSVPVHEVPGPHYPVAGAIPVGLATLDPESQPTKLPAPGPMRNGVPGGNGAALGVGQVARGGFGLGDLIADADGAPTPLPGAAAVAALGRATVAGAPGLAARATSNPFGAAVDASASVGLSTPVQGRQGRPVKLVLAALAVVVVLCGIVGVWMFRRPAPVAAVPEPTKATGADFAGLAEKLAKEEAQATPPTTPEKAAPPPAADPKAVQATPVGPTKVTRKARRRGLSTTPPPVGTGATPTEEERQAANRLSESTGRDVRLASPGGGGASHPTTPAQADISRVINNNRQGIQTCYQRALLRDNTLTHGKVTVRVSIGLSGKVKSVSLDAPAQFRALEPCIREVMSRWAFPPSSEEYGTEFPVVLQGNQ